MSGTKAGGKLAAEIVKKKYGDDFYRKIGHMGGLASTLDGFAHGKVDARVAGSKGGSASRRKKHVAV